LYWIRSVAFGSRQVTVNASIHSRSSARPAQDSVNWRSPRFCTCTRTRRGNWRAAGSLALRASREALGGSADGTVSAVESFLTSSLRASIARIELFRDRTDVSNNDALPPEILAVTTSPLRASHLSYVPGPARNSTVPADFAGAAVTCNAGRINPFDVPSDTAPPLTVKA